MRVHPSPGNNPQAGIVAMDTETVERNDTDSGAGAGAGAGVGSGVGGGDSDHAEASATAAAVAAGEGKGKGVVAVLPDTLAGTTTKHKRNSVAPSVGDEPSEGDGAGAGAGAGVRVGAGAGAGDGNAPSSHGHGSVQRSDTQRGLAPNLGCCGNRHHHALAKHFALLRDSGYFQTFIIAVIFVAGIQVGIQTYPVDPESTLNEVLLLTDTIILIIFILEIVIKMVAEGHSPWRFFQDSWNVFDFTIVAVGLMPIGGGSAVTALRLIRLLRVLKLVRALPKLRLLVMGLLQSMSSIAYIGLLLGMLFYLYAVVGVSMFGINDPHHMGTLHITLLTLFRCATLEDWSDIMYIAMYGCDNWGYDGMEDECVQSIPKPVTGVLYYASFVVLANMMILNLFIGVITTSMAEAKVTLEQEMVAEEEERQRAKRALLGLPTESEAEESDLDEAISSTLDRIQYLFRKYNVKVGRFTNALHNVSRKTLVKRNTFMHSQSDPLAIRNSRSKRAPEGLVALSATSSNSSFTQQHHAMSDPESIRRHRAAQPAPMMQGAHGTRRIIQQLASHSDDEWGDDGGDGGDDFKAGPAVTVVDISTLNRTPSMSPFVGPQSSTRQLIATHDHTTS